MKSCICRHCKKEFKVSPSDLGKFCSKECHNTSRIKRVKVECFKCGNEFETFPSEIKRGGGKYCSHGCSLKYGEGHPKWTGGRYKTTKGYIFIQALNHPNADPRGYVKEHRFVISKYLGRALLQDEDIHHLNHIKDDNRLSNLILLSKSEHTKLHWMEVPT